MFSPGYAAAPADEDRRERAKDEQPNPDSISLAAEQAVAGALFPASPALAAPVLDRLADNDIADPRCRFVVSTIRRMHADQVPVDEVTFAGYVERHALLDAGPQRQMLRTWVHEIASAAPIPMSLPYYASMVLEAAARRIADEGAAEVRRIVSGASLADLRAVVDIAHADAIAAIDRSVAI